MKIEKEVLMAAVEKAEERYKRYSKRAALFEWLYLVLIVSVSAFLFLGAVVYLSYGYDYRPPFVVGATLWTAGCVAYILHVIYDVRAAETARQVCKLKCMFEQEKEMS